MTHTKVIHKGERVVLNKNLDLEAIVVSKQVIDVPSQGKERVKDDINEKSTKNL